MFRRFVLESFLSDSIFLADLGLSRQVLHNRDFSRFSEDGPVADVVGNERVLMCVCVLRIDSGDVRWLGYVAPSPDLYIR